MMRQFQTVNDPAQCDSDGFCEAGEDALNCSSDCAQVGGSLCGNGLCEIGDGEDCTTCAADCAGVQTGSGGDFCCGTGGTNPIACGIDATDRRCIDGAAQLFCRTMPRLLASCGDHLCEGQETAASCPQDCSVPFCEATEITNELSCADGEDNDCDGNVDIADTDCQPDTDADGVTDALDNCTLVPNGLNDMATAGPFQNDTDIDGYGNICDPDFNGNGIVDPVDFSLLKQRFGQTGFPDQDLNGNGIVDPVDFSLLKTMFGQPPGPSGIAP
jgi:hypothetical protein